MLRDTIAERRTLAYDQHTISSLLQHQSTCHILRVALSSHALVTLIDQYVTINISALISVHIRSALSKKRVQGAISPTSRERIIPSIH